MARGDAPLIAVYFLLKYWKAWAVLIPVGLIAIGYFFGASYGS